MTTKVITQSGDPVEETPDEADEDIPTFEDDIRAMAEDIHKGVRKFSTGVLFKVGVIAVTIKAIDVIGKIVLENQRLKAKKQDDEQ